VISAQPGDAAKAKLVNNLMAGIHLMAGAEALALAERLGLDAQPDVRADLGELGQSWMFDDRMPRALAGDFEPRAQSHVLTKDVRLANEAAAAAGLSLPLGAMAANCCRPPAMAAGGPRTMRRR
jgi:putative dehydrogenase